MTNPIDSREKLVERLAVAMANISCRSWAILTDDERKVLWWDAKQLLHKIDDLGLIIVPKEPTEEMVEDMWRAIMDNLDGYDRPKLEAVVASLKAALSASPFVKEG